MFEREQILELKEKLDYRKFYRQYLELSGYGDWMKAKCPFHNDSNPSFAIHEKTGIWHCKSKCGSGDVIDFYQQLTNKSFSDSVLDIAKSQDIELKISPELKRKLEIKSNVFKISEYVANVYQQALSQNIIGQEYVVKRQLDIDTIKKFKIGYVPKFELKNLSPGIAPLLEYAGLLRKNAEYNTYYNYFSDKRISIPFMDENGHIVGFSTRVTDESIVPKYLHSRNNEVFQKSDLLFGYHLAKAKIKEVKTVILTEGQFDTIRAHQYGIENCVSMCGLALSEKQVKTLKEHVKNYYIVLEDSKGEAKLDLLYNAISTVDYFANVRVIKLYDEVNKKQDLDDFLLSYGKGPFFEKIKQAHTYNEYKLIDSMKGINYKTIEDKKGHIYNNRKYLLNIKNPIDRNQYIELLSNKLELPENDIRRVISRAEVEDNLIASPYNVDKDNRVYVSQLYILASFFSHFEMSDVYEVMQKLKVQNKLENRFKKIFGKITDCLLTNGNIHDIINVLHSSEVMTSDELKIVDESFMKYDEFVYLEDKYELEEFLKDQLENLR